jgi:hypothetical protein
MKPIDLNQTTITNYMYLGILPFFICALGPWVFADYEARLTTVFLFYSSIILVFLAGTIWSLALFSGIAYPNRHIHLAIIFSLWPFVAFFLTHMLASGLLLLGFLLLLFWEKCFINAIYPSWYQKLRHQITFIVVACHMLVIFNLLKA